MSQIPIFRGQRLPRPIGVDWLRQISPNMLMNLEPNKLLWFFDGDMLECAVVTQTSERVDIKTEPAIHGIQVFYSSRTRICSPRLIRDGEESGLYLIVDREAAYDYYEKQKPIPAYDGVIPIRRQKG